MSRPQHVARTSGRSRGGRALRGVLALGLLSLSLVLLTAAPSVAAPGIVLTKSAPGEVLVGGDIAYALTATNPTSNPDAVPEYNLSFRDVLPLGVTYTPGSTTPASFGEPTVYTDAGTGQQTLVWRNVADLSPGSTARLGFTAAVDETVNPVGRTITNNGGVYANSNPRFVPRFDANGAPLSGFTQSATDDAATLVTALILEKSEPSPEGELLRGVHDHTTVYTLEVTNNDSAATSGVTVTDYLPAALEFLGCGGVDNTTTGPEYASAPALTATPAVAPCVVPVSVATVTNPPGYPAGLYTAVTWELGDLAAGGATTIRYAAGIPQRANTGTWDGPTPTEGSLGQAANLDNNNGPSTRELAGEASLTNRAAASGTYSGPVYQNGDPQVTSSDTATVSVEDVRLRKSASAGTFAQGGDIRYTLLVETSEYADADAIVLTDRLPNGICPLSDDANYATGAPADCDPAPQYAPSNATIDSVVQNPDGSFDLTFEPLTLAANGTLEVEYSARMRTTYTGGALAGEPTSAGDTFTNTVALLGDATPPPDVEAPAPDGTEPVTDDSSTTITAGGPTLSKTILPNTTPMDCTVGTYEANPPADQVTFSKGSRVCFKIRIDFPTDVATRNATLTDFLPDYLVFDSGSVVPTPDNDVAYALDTSGPDPIAVLGDPNGSGTFVAQGSTFEVIVSATVGTPGAGPAPDLTSNLAKLRYSDGTGGTVSLRDSVDLAVAAPPPLSILKGVSRVNGDPAGGNAPDTDGVTVVGDDVVTFRIDYTNDGDNATSNALDVFSPDIWDVLPAGIACADISAISDAGVCTDPGDPGHPTFTGQATRSAVRWNLTAAPALAPGATATLTYDMTIPSEVSVTTTFTNTASVASYATETNLEVPITHYPEDNVDTSVDPADWDVPAAVDPSNVVTPNASVSKASTSDIVDTNNSAGQAVVGELVTYTVGLRIPGGTTVYNGVLTDPMPTGLTFVSASAAFSATDTSPAVGPLPGGVTLNPLSGTLTFPATYTNPDATPHLFEVTIRARVSTLGSNTHNVTRTNTATFASATAASGGTALPNRTASSAMTVVAPLPTLAKTDDDADNVVVAGQQITYTLTATNTNGRPTLHDTWVVDCLPGALIFGSFVSGTGANGTPATDAGDGTNGCAAGTTRIRWNLPDLVAGTPRSISYTATVSPAAAAGAAYTNTATLTGGTLDDGKTDPLDADNPLERTYTATASDTVTVVGSSVLKSADPTSLTIGEEGTWTITQSIPANVNLYDAAIIDLLPRGIDVDSLRLDSIACTNADTSPCTLPGGGSPLTSQASGGGTTYVGWLLGDLLAEPQVRVVTLTYSAIVEDLAGIDRNDTLVNTAWGRWNLADGTDPTSAGSTFDRSSSPATATVTVREPVLSIAKTVDDSTPAPGQEFTYSVALTNLAGPNTSPAFDVEIVDIVPTGVVVDAGSISNGGVLTGAGADGGGTITWTLAGPLATGSTTTLTYDAVLADSTSLSTTALVNVADITTYQSLADGGREYDGPTDPASVTPAFPEVVIDKTVASGPAYIGEPKSWTLRITNTGSSTAFDVDADDTLPENWTYDAGSATLSVDGGAATPAEPALGTSGGRQTLTWTDLADLDPGEDLVISFTATPGPDVVTSPGVGASVPHTNTAGTAADDATGASGNAEGPYAGPDDSASTAIHSADVVMTKSHTGDAVAGAPLSWTLVVRNDGPDTAVGPFTVLDTLPDGIGATTATGSGWTCSVAVAEVTCTRTNPANTLASGASFPAITVSTAIPADTAEGTVFTNEASVTDRTYDPDPDNNTDTDSATSVREVDLAIEKELSGDLVAGTDATYTLVVTNNGPSDSEGPLQVVDPVPAGTTFVSAAGPGWSCSEAAGEVTCTRAAGLALGQSAPAITLVVAVASDRTTAVENTATVSGPSTDPVPGNNTDTVVTVPGQSADLGIEKASTTPFVPGTNGTYRLTVTNFGPSDAAAVVRISDTLPAELTYVSATSVSGSWTCSATGQDLTCDLSGDLIAGDEAIVDVVVAVDPAHVGDTVNEASVDSPTPDPNPANNTDDDLTSSTAEADLAITKSHGGTVVAGQSVTFTLQVDNLGPSDSAGPIEVTDALPTGLTFVSADGTGWSCTGADQEATCVRAAGLPAGASAPPITLVALVAPDAGPATRINFASVNGPDEDPEPGNNTDLDPVVITDDTNISLVKSTTGANPVNAGDPVEFTVVVTNDGPSDADDVRVVDPVPAGLTVLSVTGAGWDCAADDPIVCERANVAAGTDAPPIVITALVGSGVPDQTTITNTATASTSTPGDDPDDNTDDATVGVNTAADLAIDKSHAGDPVVAGGQVTFDLVVENLGPSDAQPDVEVTDTLPVGLTFVSSDGPWSCTPGSAGPSGQEVTCVLLEGALLSGATAPTLSLTVQVDAAADADTYVNTATVQSPTNDPDPDNNTDTDAVEVDTQADVAIVKTHGGPVRVGDELTFTLQVRNTGPSEARDVVVTDSVPAALELLGAQGAGWTCTVQVQDLDCALDDPLAPDTDAEPIEVTVRVLAAAYPSVDNTAVVDTSTTDADPDNNTDTDTVVVPALSDLAIAKSHTGSVQVGDRLTYRVEVTNNGPTDDPGPVTVTDSLPVGLTFVSASGAGWSCSAAGQDVTCVDADGLSIGETSVIQVRVSVGAEAYPEVVNTASVTSPAEDTDPDNDSDTDPTPVAPKVRLTLQKELVGITADRATYRLTVTNNGPSATVADIVVVDRLPAELRYVSSSGPGWTCTPAGQVVTCTTGRVLAAGESSAFTLVTRIVPGTTGTIRNEAEVLGGDETDPGDEDDVTGTVPPDGSTPGGLLPDAGGPAWQWLALATLSLVGGIALIARSRRTAPEPVEVEES